jgi:tRNA A37 threonylcarbamoyladenosine modification protein TsaB
MGEVSVGIYVRDADGQIRAPTNAQPSLIAAGQVTEFVARYTSTETTTETTKNTTGGMLIAIGDGCSVAHQAGSMPDCVDVHEEVPALSDSVARLALNAQDDAWLDAEHAQPVYLRGADAWKTVDQQRLKNAP